MTSEPGPFQAFEPGGPGPGPGAETGGAALVCIGCGYDLRASDPTGLCPECGLPVADTLAKKPVYRPLLETDREWALRIARGMECFAAYLGLTLAVWVSALVLVIGLGVFWAVAGQKGWALPKVGSSGLLVQSAAAAVMLVRLGVFSPGLFALWALGCVEPGEMAVVKKDSWRTAAQVAFVLMTVLVAVEVLIWGVFICFGHLLGKGMLDALSSLGELLIVGQSGAWLLGENWCLRMGIEMAGRLGSKELMDQAVRTKSFFKYYVIGTLVTVALVVTCCLHCLAFCSWPVTFVLWIAYVVMVLGTYPAIAKAVRARVLGLDGPLSGGDVAVVSKDRRGDSTAD